MSQKRWRPLCLLPLIAAAPCLAGPPYVTDDPEPVELHHWEFYFATEQSKVANTFSATAPHLEINFGAAPNLQVHTIIPINYVNSGSGPQYGFGDLELGAKFRFIEEGQWLPQFGIFPLFEVPTGDAARGLGNGAAQALLPLWLQKSFGRWTMYGGAGYWLNLGAGNTNYVFAGLLGQCQVIEILSIGAEIFHTTPKTVGGESETNFNIGTVLDLGKMHHLLFSIGRGIQGPNVYQGYLGYLLTFGPEKKIDNPQGFAYSSHAKL